MNNYDFDEYPKTYISEDEAEYLIKTQVEVRTSRFIAQFCVCVVFLVLFLSGVGAALIISNNVNQPPIIIKNPD